MEFTRITTKTYAVHVCSKCGIHFALDSIFEERNLSQKEKGVGWCCPNPLCGSGAWHYTGESHEAKISRLENEKKLEQEKRERAERDAQIFRDEAFKESEKNKKLRKKALRVKKGCCPECNRSFVNLQRHMVTKHTPSCKSEKGYKIKSRKLP